MALIKKNIWLAFQLIVIAWSAIFISAAIVTYNNVYYEIESQQKNLTRLNAHTLIALFEKYEIVLDVMAVKLSTSDGMPPINETRKLMNAVLATDDALEAMALFDLRGTMYVSTALTDLDDNYNIYKIPHAKETFAETLLQQQAVVGRTYFSERLQTLIIPIRKAVRSPNGELRFVLSATISVEKGLEFLVGKTQKSDLLDAFIFRTYDHYFQLAPFARSKLKESYLHPVPLELVEKGLRKLSQRIDFSIEEVKEKEIVLIDEIDFKGGKALAASVFSNRYQVWLTTASSMEAIRTLFIKDAVILFSVFLISLLLIFMLFKNIAESEKKKSLALSHQANHDYLTQLSNRFHLDIQLKSLDQSTTSYSLIFIDLDNFKSVNDRFGHDAGDDLLQEVASRLSLVAEPDELLIRYSGDEFILVMFSNDGEQVSEKCINILSALKTPHPWKGINFELSASLGASSYPNDGNNPDEIMRNADLAMYEAKKTGNTFVVFHERLKATFLFQTQIEQALKTAINNNEFYMVYQPQFRADDTLHGVEALIRWKNDKLGPIGPHQFIPIAESSGMMPQIGEFVLIQAIKDIAEIQSSMHPDMKLSVNVSVTQFSHTDFAEKVKNALTNNQFDATNLVLEITESVFIEDVIYIGDLFTHFKKMGIRISLDDFGTGYSSLSYLKELPIDELKIDKSFIDHIEHKDSARLMVRGIIGIAKSLGIETVSEGVEDNTQLEMLKELDCEIIQGYVHARPMDKKELIDFIKDIKL